MFGFLMAVIAFVTSFTLPIMHKRQRDTRIMITCRDGNVKTIDILEKVKRNDNEFEAKTIWTKID